MSKWAKPFWTAAVAGSLLCLSGPVGAEPHECRATGMRRSEPIVRLADTAKSIFLAVEDDFFPDADKTTFPDVAVRDEGEWWSVFRWRAPEGSLADGTFRHTIGGGQLSLRIDKCDGSISEVWLTR